MIYDFRIFNTTSFLSHDVDESADCLSAGSLPTSLDSFVHHDLTSTERMSYTNAAVSSIAGAPHAAFGTSLAFAAALSCEQDAGVIGDATCDPYEAYRRLGIDADQLVQRFAMCCEESCCNLLPISGLKTYRQEEGHPHPSGQVGTFYVPRTTTSAARCWLLCRSQVSFEGTVLRHGAAGLT